MKRIFLAFVLLGCSTAAEAETFVADRAYQVVAEILQKRLPDLAVDRLFEAKRIGAGMNYAFWIKAEKAWVEEVRIDVRQKAATSSDVSVDVVRIDGGLIKSTTTPVAAETSAWTNRIREIVAQ